MSYWLYIERPINRRQIGIKDEYFIHLPLLYTLVYLTQVILELLHDKDEVLNAIYLGDLVSFEKKKKR